jgi:hypothetical protein
MEPDSIARRPASHRMALVIVLLVCAVVYASGLFGGFLFDDYGSIVDNRALINVDGSWPRWLALALSSEAGILRRPLSMLSFGLDYWLFGLSPLAFKIHNLVLHLVNGLLLFALAKRLAPRLMPASAAATAPFVALVAMALWLLHPLNVGSVVYIVQRMNLLAVAFMLAGLLCYADGRERMQRGESGLVEALGGLSLFGFLAVFSKENGALIVGFALVIEAVCYRFALPGPRKATAIKAFFGLTVLGPIVLVAAYLSTHPQWFAKAYAVREFTLAERLLTEPRILCDYLRWIFLPFPRWMGIYHDDIAASTGLLSPPTTTLSILFLLAAAIAAWRLRQRVPGFTFAVAWFLVGHSMESTFVPLELAFDHRNYLPMAGVILGTACALVPWLAARVSPRALAAASAAVLLVFGSVTAVWAWTWGDPLRLALAEAANHPQSSRAQYEAGRRIIFDGTANDRRSAAELEAVPYFERGRALDATDLFSASSLILIRNRQKHEVSESDVKDFARRAKTTRVPHVNPFLVVLTAATTGDLPLDAEQMKLLVHSALDNPAFPPSMRAMIFSDYGHYQFQIAHDNQSAVSLTLAAAMEDPGNPLFEINLVKLALALGDPVQAAAHLEAAKRLNKVGYYDRTIADLQQQVAAAEEAAASQ